MFPNSLILVIKSGLADADVLQLWTVWGITKCSLNLLLCVCVFFTQGYQRPSHYIATQGAYRAGSAVHSVTWIRIRARRSDVY